jgi:DNA replication licensing factor MCM7
MLVLTPWAQVVTYTCEECGFETYQEVTGRSFMPLDKCKSPVCVQYNSNNKLMQSRGSKFQKFQELKIQELPSQVPTGHIPRMMTVPVSICKLL